MTANSQSNPPDALLLTGTHCPYCPTVLRELKVLEAEGAIGQVETVNIEEQPEIARELGVRTVPWVRIGPFELEGLRSGQELREWAEKAGQAAGMAAYFGELLGSGKINKVLVMIRADPAALDALLLLFEATDTPLNTRIGISAVMEHLEGSDVLTARVARLGQLTRHPDPHIRGDACHYLALSGSEQAVPFITPLLEDEDANVRELAHDSLTLLQQ